MHPVFAWLPHGADWIFTMGLVLSLVVLGSVIWIAALFDCLRNESVKDKVAIVWIFIVVFTHWVGGLLYLLIRRPQRIRELGH